MHILVNYFSAGLFENKIIQICYNIVFLVKNRMFTFFLLICLYSLIIFQPQLNKKKITLLKQ